MWLERDAPGNSSCERAHSLDALAALDAITAFAVPTPFLDVRGIASRNWRVGEWANLG